MTLVAVRHIPSEVILSIDTALTLSILALTRALIGTRERLSRLEGIEEQRRHAESTQRAGSAPESPSPGLGAPAVPTQTPKPPYGPTGGLPRLADLDVRHGDEEAPDATTPHPGESG